MSEARRPPDMPLLFARALEALAVDVARVRFAELAKPSPDRAHRVALAALFGAKAIASSGAFWFSQRELFAGAALGFPHALLVVDPLALVDDAADRDDVASLDARLTELVEATSRAGNGDGASLDRARYESLFDPALVAFASLAFDGHAPAAKLAEAKLDPAARTIAEALAQRVAANDARATETWRALTSTTASTGPADEGFWADVAFHFVAPAGESDATPGVLGVFAPSSLVPLVPNQTVPARVLLVDDAAARALSSRLRASAVKLDAPARGDLVDVARERLRELRAVLQRVEASRGHERLALRRLTAMAAADDAALARLRRG
jgi:hypothetical protein